MFWIVITETWLRRCEPKFNNYKCRWKHRPDRVSGGLGILVKSNLQYDEINLFPFKNGALEVQAIDLHLVNGTKFHSQLPTKLAIDLYLVNQTHIRRDTMIWMCFLIINVLSHLITINVLSQAPLMCLNVLSHLITNGIKWCN